MLTTLKRFTANRDGNKVNYGKFCEIYTCLIFSCFYVAYDCKLKTTKDDAEKPPREKSQD